MSYETRPLADVNDAISEVLHSKAKARLAPLTGSDADDLIRTVRAAR